MSDDMIGTVCRAIKLSSLQSVAFGYALIEWNFADAKKFLRNKLPEVLSGTSLGEVNDDIIQGLYRLISSSEVSLVTSDAL